MSKIKLANDGQIAYMIGQCPREQFYKKLPLREALVEKYGKRKTLLNTWDFKTIEKGWFRITPQGTAKTPCLYNAKKGDKGAFKGMFIKSF